MSNTEYLNKIKPSCMCCVYCGKTYKTRSAVEKHVLLCELIHKKTTEEEDSDEVVIPTNLQLYKIIIGLHNKCVKLEEKVLEMEKCSNKQNKKINVLEWLSTVVPDITFDRLSEYITIIPHDIDVLLDNKYNVMVDFVLEKYIYSKPNLPICAFSQKPNTLYIMRGHVWTEMTKEVFVSFLNMIHVKISKAFYEWKKEQEKSNKNNETFHILCDKTMIKIMSVEYTVENCGKFISPIYLKLRERSLSSV
jgi:hypothetical protein